MTLQLLPYYFKKIGLAIFIAAGIPDLIHGFREGYNDASTLNHPASQTVPMVEKSILGIHFTPTLFTIFSVISMVGLILFAFSKDKVFDELLAKLRFEAIQITIFLSALYVLFVMIMKNSSHVGVVSFMQTQMVIFLIIYGVKKWSIKPNAEASYE